MSRSPRKFGRYVVEQEIGDGAMGRVYRCSDPLMKRLVRAVSAATTAAAADAACASRTAADAEAVVRASLREAVADDAALRSGLLGLLELSKVTSAGDA